MNLKSILLACGLLLLMTLGSRANNMLVQNVTTLGNDAVNNTIQVQFDISWDNSWRDSINYDAAWIFMKFKDANGLWQHVQLNQTGFVNGTGTANTVQVTNDKVGCWLYRTGLGSGTFNTTGMQLQWNYGLAGLTNVTGLEVRVFAVEMVYVPEGEFNCAKTYYTYEYDAWIFSAPNDNFPVINTRLSPPLTLQVEYSGSNQAPISFRAKGDAGIDANNDGVIDNTSFPLGYRAFYCCKYELTQQQYSDFLNTLSSEQISALGIASPGITLVDDQYFSSNPNAACGNDNIVDFANLATIRKRLFSLGDWSGVRPLTIFEINKASYGPIQPIYINSSPGHLIQGYPASASSVGALYQFGYPLLTSVGSTATSETASRISSGASYYGIMDLTGNAIEQVVIPYNNVTNAFDFNFSHQNGNGQINSDGSSDIGSWLLQSILSYEQSSYHVGNSSFRDIGFRFCRSAE